MTHACVVCVPARNEEVALPRLLAALARQVVPPLGVVVVANNCTDRTTAVARDAAAAGLRLRAHEVMWPAEAANVGRARGLAMDIGAAWLRVEVGDGILVSTDADAVPPPHWLAAIVRGFGQGAEIVGGQLRIAEEPGQQLWLREAQERIDRYWAAVRDLAQAIDPLPHDPPPRHGDHTGASLAVVLAAYTAAGGIPPLPSREDVALVEAVEGQGGRVRHPADVWVEVSPREEGRAERGMASEIRKWRDLAATGTPHLLPDASHWQATFRRRRRLREMFLGGVFAAEGELSAKAMRDIARRVRNDIAFVAGCEARLSPMPITVSAADRAAHEMRELVRSTLAA